MTFSLTHSLEAIIPAEIAMLSARTENQKNAANEEDLLFNLDQVESLWGHVMAEYRQKMARVYNKNVKHWSFIVGDLVMKRADVSWGVARAGKLESN